MPPKVEIERLKAKKNQSIESITRISRYVQQHENEPESPKMHESMSARKDLLIELYEKVQDIQAEIMVIDKFYDDPLDFIEDQYFDTLTIINALLRKPADTHTQTVNPANTQNHNDSIDKSYYHPNLNPINIPTFDGNLTEFKPFIDLFDALIDKDKRRSDVEKLCHLKSHLKGEPLSLINNLPTVNSSYAEAITLLKDRYNNESILICHHIHKILDIPSISRCTAPALRDFISKVKQQLGALKNMRQPVDSWDMLLICILSKKLDQYTNRSYQIDRNASNLPTVKEFLNYLESRAAALEAVNLQETFSKSKEKSVHLATQFEKKPKQDSKCSFCSLTNHKIFNCRKFKAISVSERVNFIDRQKLCKLCLNDHLGKCKMTFRCSTCQRDHNALLHRDTPLPNPPNRGFVAIGAINQSDEGALLPTVVLKVRGTNGKFTLARCLVDTGSQVNLVTSDLVQKLNIKTFQNNISLVGIAGNSTKIDKAVNLDLKSCVFDYDLKIKCSVVEKVSHTLPQVNFNTSLFEIPKTIILSDKNFNKSGTIDILLNTDIFFKILLAEKIECNGLILQNTLFGFIVSGAVPNSNTTCHFTSALCCQTMDTIISKFWETEKVPEIFPEYNSEQEACEDVFKSSLGINDNKYQVKLPLKQDLNHLNLGDSFSVALKRFENLEKRFKINPDLFRQYKKFIDEYLDLGHAKVVDLSTYDLSSGSVYFMAHHPVIREDKKTTKLRVVFDGSMKSKDKKCINDFLYNGAVVQNELFDILCLFRTYQYVFITDIRQMYRMILIHPENRCLQNILWREPNGPLQCLQLQTVTYGLKSSSFLATRSLLELANSEGKNFPLASQAIINNTYVDDILTGHETVQGTIELKNQLIALLQKRSFELHKWCSNNPEILQDIPKEKQNFDDIDISKNNFVVKTLGLSYDTKTDQFRMSSPFSFEKLLTKRQVLSFIAQFYDPLGLAGPVLITAKVIMQKIWVSKIKWDDLLPHDLLELWETFVKNFLAMPTINIPRNLHFTGADIIELLGFCDSSNYCFGACVYARAIFPDRVCVNLICSKSRIVPLNKKLTIPRLELNAALLLSNLIKKVHVTLIEKINNVFLYSDSSIVLSWIKSKPVKLNPYVANRILKIHEFTNKFHWLYINTKENPADMLSRGIEPQELESNQLWFHGPSQFSAIDFQHTETHFEIPSPLLEVQLTILENKRPQSFFQRFSSISQLERIVSYMLKFSNNSKNRKTKNNFKTVVKNNNKKISFPLKVSELDNSLKTIIKYEQSQHFQEEIKCLQSFSPISKGPLCSLAPFIDHYGLLRVGGRLQHAKGITYDQQHPIILPKNNHITDLIIRREHFRLLHAGPRQVLSSLNLKFWLISGNREVKKILHKCVTCFKHKAKCSQQLMGSLPEQRVCSARVFQHVGIDFCGPFLIRQSRIRKSIETKSYIALFVCFSVKAIHMELVSDLSTSTFLAALKRFISRRGKPSKIFCDNGLTFKGAKNHLHEILSNIVKNQEKIHYFCLEEKIEFNFIPSYSPVFGGLWEAGVKSAKYHIKRVYGHNTCLTYEELNTLIIQVEGILNSRPLMPLSHDPSDLEYLTPGHFLIGAPITSFPEHNLNEIPQNRLKIWKLVVQMQQHFWSKWHKDYLTQLQNRPKWRTEQANLKVGMLVLLKEDNVPSYKWPVGRIVRVIPGKDTKVRVCEVKTNTGTYLRSVTKIAVLPIN